MIRKALIAATAALALGGASVATSADAAPHGGWHGGGGYHGGGWHGGYGYRGGWRGGYGYGWGPGVYYGAGYYDGCGLRWSPRWGRYVRACW